MTRRYSMARRQHKRAGNKYISLPVTAELKGALDAIAAYESRTLSYTIRAMLILGIKTYEKLAMQKETEINGE